MANRSTMPVRNPDIVSKELSELHDTSGLSWRKIASLDDYMGIPPGTLDAIAKGYPIPKRWRRRLGLPLVVPTEACPECGQVHKIDGICTERAVVNITVYRMTAEEYYKVEKPVKITLKRRNGKHPGPPRASINLENPASAAATIRRKMTPEILAALVELLRGEE